MDPTEEAAKIGDVIALSVLAQDGSQFDDKTFAAAAREGQLECLQFLYTHWVYWMHEEEDGSHISDRIHHCPWDSDTLTAAAEGGHLECLRFALQQGCPWDGGIAVAAAAAGHVDCLQFLHEQHIPWDSETGAAAIKGGHVHCLEWLYDNGSCLNVWTCEAAATAGDLKCLQWLTEHLCPWDPKTCTAAAREGHLECLKWLHGQYYPWGPETCAAAAREGHLECLQWLHAHDCPWDSSVFSPGCLPVQYSAMYNPYPKLRLGYRTLWYCLAHGAPTDRHTSASRLESLKLRIMMVCWRAKTLAKPSESSSPHSFDTLAALPIELFKSIVYKIEGVEV